MPTVRFFCNADASEVGLLALAYCNAMVAISMPVRLVASSVAHIQTLRELGKGEGWAKHQALFLTPIDHKDYVNVVCGDERDQKRLYTVGVKNILITGRPPPPDAADCRVVMQYHAVVVPTRDLADRWRLVGCHAVVVPIDWADHASTLRSLLWS